MPAFLFNSSHTRLKHICKMCIATNINIDTIYTLTKDCNLYALVSGKEKNSYYNLLVQILIFQYFFPIQKNSTGKSIEESKSLDISCLNNLSILIFVSFPVENHWSLNKSKSAQRFRTFLSIPTNLINAIV